jgi:hypothetical protein
MQLRENPGHLLSLVHNVVRPAQIAALSAASFDRTRRC